MAEDQLNELEKLSEILKEFKALAIKSKRL